MGSDLSIKDLENEQREAEMRLNRTLFMRSRVLALGLPILFLVLVSLFLLMANPTVGRVIGAYILEDLLVPYLGRGTHVFIIILFIIWLLPLAISGTFYYFLMATPVKRAKDRLKEITEDLLAKRLGYPDERRLYLQEQFQKLRNMTARVFFENEDRYDQAVKWHKEAGEILDKEHPNLNESQFLLNSINELVLREEREQREQRNWQFIAILIMILYIVALVVPVIFTDAATSNQPIQIFGIPLSVVMWGAAGSLAAILYRFYTEKGRVRFASEVRWLIARPIIGIIMGAVVYIALVSGLVLVGGIPSTTSQTSSGSALVGRIEVYWVLAFLAGFSDKFYIGIIDLLVEKTIKTKENETKELKASRGSKKESENRTAAEGTDGTEKS
jgi:hypothetical protein